MPSEAWYSVVTSIKAVGNVVNVTEANTKESFFLRGEILEGLSASTGRGMYEEKYTRTWETLLVPDSKGWNEVPVFLGRKNGT